MTLTKIEVKDFQSIESGKVEVGSFTVFTGPSSSGKSAFMRAAQVVIRNNFTPSQVRQGAKDTEVVVCVDGHTIKATRGSKTGYSMDGEEWTKVGRNGPPDEVTKVLGLPMISEVESTFSTQFDKPYLIADTGSIGSKVLGSLTNVSVLHGSLKEASRRVKETNSSLRLRTNDIGAITEQLKDFEDVERMEALVQEAQAKLETISEIEAKISQLRNILTLVGRGIMDYEEAKAMVQDLEPAKKILGGVESCLGITVGLSNLLDRIRKLENSRPTWEYSKVPKGVDLTGLEDNLGKMSELQTLMKSITSRVEDFHKVTADIELTRNKQADTERQYGNLFEDINECPLCNQPLGDHLD